MNLEKPTIVIWDMDGTTVRHLNPKLLHILEKLDDFSYRIKKVIGWAFKRSAKGPILPPQELQKREDRKKRRVLVQRALHKMRRKPVEQIVTPRSDIYKILNLLKDHNIPQALVSNGLGKGYGYDILQKFNLEDFYGATIFREDIINSKPHPEPLLLALKDMDIQPQADDTIWYIGDRYKDVLASLAARERLCCKVIPIACAPNAAYGIVERGEHPDQIILDYKTMFAKLQNLLKIQHSGKDVQAPNDTAQELHTS